jgi:hypothetical protein
MWERVTNFRTDCAFRLAEPNAAVAAVVDKLEPVVAEAEPQKRKRSSGANRRADRQWQMAGERAPIR